MRVRATEIIIDSFSGSRSAIEFPWSSEPSSPTHSATDRSPDFDGAECTTSRSGNPERDECPRVTNASSIDALATEYSGKAIVAKVDVDKAPGVASRFGVVSIPTVMVFKGGQAVDRVLGLVPKASLAQKLDAALK